MPIKPVIERVADANLALKDIEQFVDSIKSKLRSMTLREVAPVDVILAKGYAKAIQDSAAQLHTALSEIDKPVTAEPQQ